MELKNILYTAAFDDKELARESWIKLAEGVALYRFRNTCSHLYMQPIAFGEKYVLYWKEEWLPRSRVPVDYGIKRHASSHHCCTRNIGSKWRDKRNRRDVMYTINPWNSCIPNYVSHSKKKYISFCESKQTFRLFEYYKKRVDGKPHIIIQ